LEYKCIFWASKDKKWIIIAPTLIVNSNTSMSAEEGDGFGYTFLDELLALAQLSPPPKNAAGNLMLQFY